MIYFEKYYLRDVLQCNPIEAHQTPEVLFTVFLLVSCFACSSTSKMIMVQSSETSVVRSYIPKVYTLHSHHYKTPNQIMTYFTQ
jgi:hypothetical protein